MEGEGDEVNWNECAAKRTRWIDFMLLPNPDHVRIFYLGGLSCLA